MTRRGHGTKRRKPLNLRTSPSSVASPSSFSEANRLDEARNCLNAIKEQGGGVKNAETSRLG